MLIEDFIKKISLEFVQYWNEEQWERMSAYMKDDIEIHSPFIQLLFPDNTNNVLVGKDKLIAYWKILKSVTPNFVVTLDSLNKIDHEVFITLTAPEISKRLQVNLTYNEYAKIVKIFFEYQTIEPDNK